MSQYRTQTRSHHGIILAALAATVLSTGTTIAQQQNEPENIGFGQALDANLSATDGRLNTGRQPFMLNRLNNAIVTGNVAGGKGFRGDLGYTAAGDFRGQAGSNDLFSVTAGAYQPGLILQRASFLQVQSRSGLVNPRYQMSFQPTVVLSRPASGLSTGDFYTSRTMGGSVQVDPTGGLQQLMQPSMIQNSTVFSAGRLSRDVRESVYGEWGSDALRATPTWFDTADSDMRPLRENLNEIESPRSSFGTDSTFRLLRRLESERGLPGASGRGLPADWVGRGTPGQVEQRLADAQEAGGLGALQPSRTGENPYLDLQARMIAQANGVTWSDDDSAYSERMIDAMKRFNTKSARRRADQAAGESGEEAGGDGGAGAAERRDPRLRLPSLDDLRDLNLPIVETLAGQADSEASEYLRAGEAALREGNYFDAERMFNEALAINPGYPLGMLGKVHAQLGAGLYRSAAWNLRVLLERHPEMAAVRTSERLHPRHERLEQVLAEIDDMQMRKTVVDGGLLIAYTSRLLGLDDRVAEGVALMEQTSQSDPLVKIFKAVWLDEPEDAGDDAANEGPADPEEPASDAGGADHADEDPVK